MKELYLDERTNALVIVDCDECNVTVEYDNGRTYEYDLGAPIYISGRKVCIEKLTKLN